MAGKMIVGVLATMLASGTALAAGDAIEVAQQLGNIIGSENACGLKYEQAAIARFIESNVDEADLSFPGYLRTSTWSAGEEMKQMSESARTAHCTQVRRAAKRLGFID